MDNDKLSKVSALALNTIFGYEPKFSHNIIDALGSTEEVFRLSRDRLTEIFGPYNRYLGAINPESLAAAEKEYDRLTAQGCRIVSIYDDAYPALLRDCPDAPMALYVRSSTPPEHLFNGRPAVAVVGTRDLSPYGREWCRRIVEAVSQAPSRPVIVSGMAIGVDITAHVAALEYGLPTIGVLPVGIDDVYPRRHAAAAERIASTPGCALVTDYPPGTSPVAFNFLRRNRIIAGMSQGLVLVESKIKGGGMMTARLAAGYGREVVALPGRIDDTRSLGCNTLIKEKTAEPIASLDSLPSQLGLGVYSLRSKAGLETAVRDRLSGIFDAESLEQLVRMALHIKKNRGCGLDEICASTGLGYAEVCKLTGILESEGFISVDLMQRCCIDTNFK